MIKRPTLTILYALIIIVNCGVVHAQVPETTLIKYVVYTAQTELHYALVSNGDLYLLENAQGAVSWGSQNAIFCGNFWGSIEPSSEIIDYSISGEASWICHYIFLNNGDVYGRRFLIGSNMQLSGDPYFMGNYWGGMVSTPESSWGLIKHK